MKSHKKLSEIIPLEKGKKKYKRAYTTGVYDLFHIGHLNIIRRAKNIADEIVVGVTTDELVQYKGRSPIIPFEERKEIIESIDCVDKVVSQEDMDKLKAARKHGCDVITVGDDWKGSEKWNKFEIELNKHGIDVVYFPYTVNASTTLIKKIIKDMN